jgi:hypothetical protein
VGFFLRAHAWGLAQVATPPVDRAAAREAGIIRAIATPSFEGSL